MCYLYTIHILHCVLLYILSINYLCIAHTLPIYCMYVVVYTTLNIANMLPCILPIYYIIHLIYRELVINVDDD
jgi:hypothetical protein